MDKAAGKAVSEAPEVSGAVPEDSGRPEQTEMPEKSAKTADPRATSNQPTAGKSWLMRLGIGLFAVGIAATITVFLMFAIGFRDLPVWLSAVAGVSTSLGLACGLIALVREAKRAG